MRLTGIIALAVVAMLGVAAPSVRAQQAPTSQPTTRPHGEHGGPLIAALKDLNLTDDQKAKVKTIMEDFRPKAEAYRAANKDKFEKAMADIKAARTSGDKTQMQAARAEMEALIKGSPMAAAIEQIKAILTPDQQTKFQAALEELRKEHGMGGGAGHRQHGGPGGGTPPAAPQQ